MDAAGIAGYLARLDVAPGRTGPEQLRALHAAHLYRVPFENLSVHNGEGIDLDPAALFDKIVTRRRGGFCYELNGSFAVLLEGLGYPVQRCACRVWTGSGFGPPFDHLALLVEASGTWLVDVGFGAHSSYPLGLAFDVDQADPDGTFRLVESSPSTIDVLKNGQLEYRLERLPRPLADFEIGAWWNSTSPKSHFTRGVLATLPNPRGRVTISDTLLITTVDGARTETAVSSEALPELYRQHFGIDLAVIPTTRT